MKKKIDPELKHARRIAEMHSGFLSTVKYFDAKERLIVLGKISTTYELIDYSGKVIAKSSRIELGLGGFFIYYDDSTKLFKLLSRDNNEIKFLAEAETMLLLKQKIEQVDPERLLGFKF